MEGDISSLKLMITHVVTLMIQGYECGGIYKSMNLLVGATVRANEGYGMWNPIAVDAAHPKPLGSMPPGYKL